MQQTVQVQLMEMKSHRRPHNSIAVPTIATVAISDITFTTATSGGDNNSDGGAPVTEKGVCWSTSAKPRADDGKTSDDGTGATGFTSNLTELTPGTKYHVQCLCY